MIVVVALAVIVAVSLIFGALALGACRASAEAQREARSHVDELRREAGA